MTDTPGRQARGRREDARLLRGEGAFTADYAPQGLLHIVFVRSPYAHARVGTIDTAAAASMPGVVAVWTATDLAREGLPALTAVVDLKRPDGSPAPSTPRPLLAAGTVRHIGEPVALVDLHFHPLPIPAASRPNPAGIPFRGYRPVRS